MSKISVHDLMTICRVLLLIIGQNHINPKLIQPIVASICKVMTVKKPCVIAELNLDKDAIEQMAVDINNAIVGVPDVDQILADTGDDVINAEKLKNDAEAVKTEAKTQLEIAEKIINELSKAAVSQDAAETAVGQTRTDIDSARTNLGQVSFF